jgi:hypothetical protein
MHSKQHGFGLVALLAIVLVIGAIGFTGWSVYNHNRAMPSVQKTTATTPPYSDWQTYSNAKYGFSIKHPRYWQVNESTNKSLAARGWADDPSTEYLDIVMAPKYDYTGTSDNTGLVITITNLPIEKMLSLGDGSGVETKTTVAGHDATKMTYGEEATIFLSVNGKTFQFSGAPIIDSVQKLQDPRVRHALDTFNVVSE